MKTLVFCLMLAALPADAAHEAAAVEASSAPAIAPAAVSGIAPVEAVPEPARASSRPGWLPLAGVLAAAAAFGVLFLLLAAARRVKKAKVVRFGTVLKEFQPDSEPRVGAVIGGGIILGPILEHGDLSCLYDARDLSDNSLVVKRFRMGASNPREKERLLAQARAFSSLAHPSLLAPTGAYEQDGEVYLAYAPVAGESLERRLAKVPGRRLGLPESLKIVEPVAAALGAAHAAGEVFGRLCPANILLDKGSARIYDLGPLSVLEAAAYAAPEQEAAPAVPASDLFALAACLYEALTGQPPFSGPDAALDRKEGRFSAPSAGVYGLPQGLDDFFKRALDADPAKRPASAADFMAEFRAASSGKARKEAA